MKKPKVSVVMPVYNAEKSVRKSIKSILKQTLQNFEFIIINDASKDKTLEIIRRYKSKDKRIRLISNSHNLKIANSLNLGISIAKADLVARMDGDDISHPKRLELQYLYLKDNPEVAIVGSNISITDNGKEVWKRTYPTSSRDLKKVMFRYSPFAHPTVMIRKKIFEEVGGYNPEIVPCEDIDLWFKIGAKYDFGNVPKTLLKYNLSDVSGSHYNLRKTELLGFKIKINAIENLGFRPSVYDIFYNILEFLSLWVMPTNLRIKFYNFLRSNGLI